MKKSFAQRWWGLTADERTMWILVAIAIIFFTLGLICFATSPISVCKVEPQPIVYEKG